MKKFPSKHYPKFAQEDLFDRALIDVIIFADELKRKKPELNSIHMAYALIQAAAMLSMDKDWPGFLEEVLSECIYVEHGQ
jgi:hypothetical protein